MIQPHNLYFSLKEKKNSVQRFIIPLLVYVVSYYFHDIIRVIHVNLHTVKKKKKKSHKIYIE